MLGCTMKTAFLSSPAKDLKDYREKAYQAIQGMDDWKCIRMEDFGARDGLADDFSRQRVGECDVFVGIVGLLYGSSPSVELASFTEREYDAAISTNRPRLLFVAPVDFKLAFSDVEDDERRRRQEAFRKRVDRERIRDSFDSPDDLAVKIIRALRNWEREDDRTSVSTHFSVELVANCTDPDILSALDLYENRIPENEKFEAPDIVRWLREDQDQRRRGIAGPRDYFVVAKQDGKVCGFTLLHYYPTVQLAFVAYLVAEKGVPTDHGFISQKLLEKVAWVFLNEEYLRPCKGFLLEVDDPGRANTPDEKRERLARVRLFSMLAESLGFSLRALDIDYHQPLLWIPETGETSMEVPMILMYARRLPSEEANNRLAKPEVAMLLAFVYKWLYPEGFSEVQEENRKYREYLDAFYEQQMALVPPEITLLRFRELRTRGKPLPSTGKHAT
jgi:Domain of unknown function (DUF4062)